MICICFETSQVGEIVWIMKWRLRSRGRSHKIWLEVDDKNYQTHQLNKEDVMNCNKMLHLLMR